MRGKKCFKLMGLITIFTIGTITIRSCIHNDKTKVEDSQLNCDVRRYYYNQLTYEEEQIYTILTSSKPIIMENEKICLAKVKKNENVEEVGDRCKKAIWAYLLDNPIATIWLNQYHIVASVETAEIILTPGKDGKYYEFKDKDELNQGIKQVKKETEKFVYQLKGTDDQKYISIQDWLLDGAEYDESLKMANTSNIFGCIIEKKAICSGFTYAFKYVTDMAQLPVISVIGTTEQEPEKEISHAWTMLYLKKQWYVNDLTSKLNDTSGRRYLFYSKEFYYPWKIFRSPE